MGLRRFVMTKSKAICYALVAVTVTVAGTGLFWGWRAARSYTAVRDFKSQVRYLIENGSTIGEAPAAETLSTAYLEAVFGEDAQLLEGIRGVVEQGLAEDPSLSLGEISAMIVTYRKNPSQGTTEDVVAHIVGGFPLSKRKWGFHKDGFFAGQLDSHLWVAGNTVISFMGRDRVLLGEPDDVKAQEEIVEAILTDGNIMPLVDALSDRPYYYTAVFPDPHRIMPPQLRGHVQALVVKGLLSPSKGSWEAIMLTPSGRSTAYAAGVMGDLRRAAIVALEGRFHGIEQEQPWGKQIDPWWAYEMNQTLKKAELVSGQNTVRLRSEYERRMVNAFLKTIERMGRDMAQMRGIMDERLDPRLVDARLKTGKALNYWSDPHRWGPNWPIAAPTNVFENQEAPPTAQGTPTPPAATPAAGS